MLSAPERDSLGQAGAGEGKRPGGGWICWGHRTAHGVLCNPNNSAPAVVAIGRTKRGSTTDAMRLTRKTLRLTRYHWMSDRPKRYVVRSLKPYRTLSVRRSWARRAIDAVVRLITPTNGNT